MVINSTVLGTLSLSEGFEKKSGEKTMNERETSNKIEAGGGFLYCNIGQKKPSLLKGLNSGKP
jgi:hypothetical protein